MIAITPELALPEEEITFTASRSSGPGGQHVNKTSTRVTLLFDVAHSPSLTEDQARRITERLGARISREGVLRVVAQRSRSQTANKDAALERFVALLQEALTREAPRIPVKVSGAQKRRRLAEKRRRARLKQQRGRVRQEGSDDTEDA
jgi:ribosome-associated protein